MYLGIPNSFDFPPIVVDILFQGIQIRGSGMSSRRRVIVACTHASHRATEFVSYLRTSRLFVGYSQRRPR